MNGIKLSETLVMPRFNVGAGTGVRASTVHGSEGPLLELYLRFVLFFKDTRRVQSQQIHPARNFAQKAWALGQSTTQSSQGSPGGIVPALTFLRTGNVDPNQPRQYVTAHQS